MKKTEIHNSVETITPPKNALMRNFIFSRLLYPAALSVTTNGKSDSYSSTRELWKKASSPYRVQKITALSMLSAVWGITMNNTFSLRGGVWRCKNFVFFRGGIQTVGISSHKVQIVKEAIQVLMSVLLVSGQRYQAAAKYKIYHQIERQNKSRNI